MAKEPFAEGPNSYNGGNGPGGATKMPTKTYPQSQKGIPKKGSEGRTIDGPCSSKPGY